MGTAETRQRIVAGAAAAVAARGLEAATVQDVLQAAGVSRRTFYQYFQSREDVLRAVYDDRVDELVGVITAAIVRVEDPVGKVLAALDAWLDWQVAGGGDFVALQTEAIRPQSLLHDRREATLDAIVTAADHAVRAALSVAVDPLVWRGLLLGIEGVVLRVAEQSGLAAERARLRRVVAGLAFAVLANSRDLPTPPR